MIPSVTGKSAGFIEPDLQEPIFPLDPPFSHLNPSLSCPCFFFHTITVQTPSRNLHTFPLFIPYSPNSMGWEPWGFVSLWPWVTILWRLYVTCVMVVAGPPGEQCTPLADLVKTRGFSNRATTQVVVTAGHACVDS